MRSECSVRNTSPHKANYLQYYPSHKALQPSAEHARLAGGRGDPTGLPRLPDLVQWLHAGYESSLRRCTHHCSTGGPDSRTCRRRRHACTHHRMRSVEVRDLLSSTVAADGKKLDDGLDRSNTGGLLRPPRSHRGGLIVLGPPPLRACNNNPHQHALVTFVPRGTTGVWSFELTRGTPQKTRRAIRNQSQPDEVTKRIKWICATPNLPCTGARSASPYRLWRRGLFSNGTG